MSGVAEQQSRLEIRDGFAGAARALTPPAPRKTTTLSIRLTAEERAKLEAAAGGAPLGRHIKDVVLRDGRRGYGMADRQALARVLRALAASNLAVDLEAVYRASLTGEIALLDGMTDVLERACHDVAEMRKELVRALGLRRK